jgi:hypothetical protein
MTQLCEKYFTLSRGSLSFDEWAVLFRPPPAPAFGLPADLKLKDFDLLLSRESLQIVFEPSRFSRIPAGYCFDQLKQSPRSYKFAADSECMLFHPFVDIICHPDIQRVIAASEHIDAPGSAIRFCPCLPLILLLAFIIRDTGSRNAGM